MNESRLFTWIWVVLVVAAAASVATLARVPDFRRYVLDAAGRRLEIRHA